MGIWLLFPNACTRWFSSSLDTNNVWGSEMLLWLFPSHIYLKLVVHTYYRTRVRAHFNPFKLRLYIKNLWMIILFQNNRCDCKILALAHGYMYFYLFFQMHNFQQKIPTPILFVYGHSNLSPPYITMPMVISHITKLYK